MPCTDRNKAIGKGHCMFLNLLLQASQRVSEMCKELTKSWWWTLYCLWASTSFDHQVSPHNHCIYMHLSNLIIPEWLCTQLAISFLAHTVPLCCPQWNIHVMMLIVLDIVLPPGPFVTRCYIWERAWSVWKPTSFQCLCPSAWQKSITPQSLSAAVVRSPSVHLHPSIAAYTEGGRRTWKRQSNMRHQSCHWCLQNAKCYQKYSWTWSSGALSFPQAKLSFQLTVAFNNTQTKSNASIVNFRNGWVFEYSDNMRILLMEWYLISVLSKATNGEEKQKQKLINIIYTILYFDFTPSLQACIYNISLLISRDKSIQVYMKIYWAEVVHSTVGL